GEVVSAFGGTETTDAVADGGPERGARPRGGAAQQLLELGERLFDRIEIGTIGRQKHQVGATGLDRLAYAGDLVAAEIVGQHDLAWREGRRQELLDIGAENV